MYNPYVDSDYYKNQYGGSSIANEELEKALKKASRHIDILTFNRLVGKDISLLPEYQQEMIKECCCEMAEFEQKNAEFIESVLKNYSINGVTMSFEAGMTIKIVSGVVVRKDTYSKLLSTGLTCRALRR